MSAIFGALKLNDSDRVFSATTGQRVIFDEANRYVAEQNAALNSMLAVFVEETTEDHSRRYKLPGGGMLQRRGQSATPGAIKATGSWDVAFPLEDFATAIAGDDVSMAYMTVAELDRHLQTVVTQNVATVRFELLKALLNKTARTFTDPLWGSLTVQPLANGDSVVYPPIIGATAEATENHYLTSGYASASISNTNDPIAGILIPELEEHFGQVTGGGPIVVFINGAEEAKVSALTAFVPIVDRYITPGVDTAIPAPTAGMPGRFLGRHAKGAWVQRWDWVPSGYMFAVRTDFSAPLIKRRDPADTGLPADLALVTREQEFPFETAYWRHRFGFGAGNRLNGIAVELSTDPTYDTPSTYA